jgi:hypothetical protein
MPRHRVVGVYGLWEKHDSAAERIGGCTRRIAVGTAKKLLIFTSGRKTSGFDSLYLVWLLVCEAVGSVAVPCGGDDQAVRVVCLLQAVHPNLLRLPNETNNLLRCRGSAERQSCSPIQRRESQPFFFFYPVRWRHIMNHDADADMQNAGTVNGVDSFVLSKIKKKVKSQI